MKITLGWELDSRRLLIKLPEHKHKAWSSQVESFISRKTTNVDDLRSVLGRLENIAIIIPTFGHFLNNIRQLEIKAALTKKNQFINKRAHEDFKLALKFLDKARQGINMNLMTFRSPNKIYINDASEHGLGGFATHGRAWAYTIPEKLQGRAHINLLEFLAQLVSIWIDVIEKRIEPLDCLLGMGDNTASMGWLRCSNFRENDEHDTEWLAKQKIARKLGELVLQSDATVYRQWFHGIDNDVADSLSRDSYFLSHTTHELFLKKMRPYSGSKQFQNTSSSERDLLVHYINTAAVARTAASVEATKTKRASSFKCWTTFIISIGIKKLYLEGFTKYQQNITMSAFAQAMRKAAFTRTNKTELVEGTVNATVSFVAQAFRSNNRPDPRLDVDGKLCFILQEQFRAYRNQDGSRRKQKALPMMVLRKMMDLSTSEREQAVSWLLIGAIFFAMRSCEYLRTSSEDKKRTKIVRIGHVIFKKGTSIVNHSDPTLRSSDLVRIKFVFQKNDRRDVCIHMFRSGDPILCPVIAWANTVQRIRKIPNTTDDSEVCLFYNNNQKIEHINAHHVRSRLRAIVILLREDKLGFNKDDIGLHSIRSGGAMAMFLSGTSVIIIMRVGRWSSEAFLEYIRDQIESFTAGVSQKMLNVEEFFNLNTESLLSQNRLTTESTTSTNENGPISVPHRIRYNRIALSTPNETE